MHKIFRLKGVTAILFYLINNDMPNQRALVANIDLNPITVGRATDVLEAYDLVTITKGKYNQSFYHLTDKGREVATLFKQIDDIMYKITKAEKNHLFSTIILFASGSIVTFTWSFGLNGNCESL